MDILVWIFKNRPAAPFTSKDISNEFNLSRDVWDRKDGTARKKVGGQVQRRLNYLLLWGCIVKDGVIEARRRGRREVQYRITEWGKQYASRKLGVEYRKN